MSGVKVIFEDSPSSPISKLLSVVYRGDSVVFSSTCDGLSEAICKELIAGVSLIVCYVDCPPDNKEAVSLYSNLREEFIDRENVCILKSQPIEYYVLKMLCDAGWVSDTSLISKYKSLIHGKYISYTDRTFEKFCKNVLNSSYPRCLKNNSNQSPSWFTCDCDCDNCGRVKPTLSQKALALMWALPYIIPYSKHDYLRAKGFLMNIDHEKAKTMCIREFNAIKELIADGVVSKNIV